MAPGMPGFDEAVAAMAKALADAAIEAAIEAATTELIADRDAARARTCDAEAEISRQHSRIMGLEAELAELQARNTEGGELSNTGPEMAAQEKPADPASGNTRKKGAGAVQG